MDWIAPVMVMMYALTESHLLAIHSLIGVSLATDFLAANYGRQKIISMPRSVPKSPYSKKRHADWTFPESPLPESD